MKNLLNYLVVILMLNSYVVSTQVLKNVNEFKYPVRFKTVPIFNNNTTNKITRPLFVDYLGNLITKPLENVVPIDEQFIPLLGTKTGYPITGSLQFSDNYPTKKLYHNSPGVSMSSEIRFEYTNLILQHKYNTDITTITFGVNGIEVRNDGSTGKGLFGYSDFSSNYTDYSYIQNSYALNLFTEKGVYNSTTVVLTTSYLNTNYGTKTVGFKVYCQDITAGAMIYEKSATTNIWLGYPCIIP